MFFHQLIISSIDMYFKYKITITFNYYLIYVYEILKIFTIFS